MSKNTTIPTTVNKTDAKEVKFYLIESERFATPAQWRLMGRQPAPKAITTEMTTKNGYQFNIVAESQTEAYDAEAHAKQVEAEKERKKQERELFNLYMKHEIGREAYIEALAQLDK